MSEESKQERLGAFPYIIGALSFIPLIGIIFSFISIIWGLSTKKVGGKKLGFIGLSGMAFSIVIVAFNVIEKSKQPNALQLKDIEINERLLAGDSKVVKIDKLLALMHMSEFDIPEKEAMRQYKENNSKNIFENIKRKYPEIVTKKKDEINRLYDQFWEELIKSTDNLDSWHDYLKRMYYDNYDEKEIDALIKHYSTSTGQKNAKQRISAATEYNEILTKESNELLNDSMHRLYEKIEKLN